MGLGNYDLLIASLDETKLELFQLVSTRLIGKHLTLQEQNGFFKVDPY